MQDEYPTDATCIANEWHEGAPCRSHLRLTAIASVGAASILPRSTILHPRIEDKARTRIQGNAAGACLGYNLINWALNGVALRSAFLWRDVVVLAILNSSTTIFANSFRSRCRES